MNDDTWKRFFLSCAEILGPGEPLAAHSDSWCSWTTYRRLAEDAGYWVSGLPNVDQIADAGIKDGSIWGQPFSYGDIAHIVIPRRFYWESISETKFESGVRGQDIDALSSKLRNEKIDHRLTDLILEIKLY